MWQRATRIRSFDSLVIRDASLEDIFREIKAQYRKAGEAKEKIWISYIQEGIARLQDNDLTIPISDRISLLASEHHEKS